MGNYYLPSFSIIRIGVKEMGKHTNSCGSMKCRNQSLGFTLIEVMITVAIIAILAAIALPSYSQYVIRSKLTEGPNFLADTRVKMEQYYQDNRNYGNSGTTCGFTMPTAKYFAYTCETSGSAQAYVIKAASKADTGLGAENDYIYTIDQSNAKATTKFKAAAQSGKNCWLVSGSEC